MPRARFDVGASTRSGSSAMASAPKDILLRRACSACRDGSRLGVVHRGQAVGIGVDVAVAAQRAISVVDASVAVVVDAVIALGRDAGGSFLTRVGVARAAGIDSAE